MNYDLTEEQSMIKKMMREFSTEEVAPGAVERDRTGTFPLEIFKQLGEMGIMGLPFPEEFGGGGGDTISFAIVTEELSRACASTGITYSAHISLGGAPLHLFGTKAQKERYLTPICTGESFGAFGLTEPNAGSDAGGTQTTAKEEGNDFIINGSKVYITNASYANHLALTAITGQQDGQKTHLARDRDGRIPGDALASQWSAKLFGYSWLATAAGRYADFRTLADAALRYVAETMKVPLDARTRAQLAGAYDALDLWPDVKPALARLHTAGVRLAFLSNLGVETLNANMSANGIAGYFEAPLSTDAVGRFKPAPEAYAMALRAFGLPRAHIGFAAFGGWDAAGATWFGYRTAWVNRFDLPVEPLDTRPAITSRGMEGVLALAGIAPA